MKLGIMQPYFVPYIGYWQLMNAVDMYVVYDDVNYIKGGWISRNRILSSEGIQYFGVQMVGASSNKLINEVGVELDERVVEKNIRKLENVYGKAPYYNDVMPVMERILFYKAENIAEYNMNSFNLINQYIGIDTSLILSSNIDKDNSLRAQDKVLDICRILGADEYYNAIGGISLYSYNDFAVKGIKLSFLETEKISYSQFRDDFQPDLSIIDVMMFNSKKTITEMLGKYRLK